MAIFQDGYNILDKNQKKRKEKIIESQSKNVEELPSPYSMVHFY